MTSQIINLRSARKAKARLAKEARARENRAKFGRTAAERLRDEQASKKRESLLDRQRLPVAPSDPDETS
ncbi:MAG: DUF4169 family protein [Alphaproteobacteria bacterium]|nr:DUF4169 family protein [Alphaproteobacteria bacterium]